MLRYPRLSEIPSSREVLDKFKGYNHNLRIGDGEFYDMKNLSADNYPVLSQRKKRGTYLTTNTPNGMCSNTKFCYVDGQDFYIGNEKHDLKITGGSKDLVSMGTNVIIMPDRKYINTIKTTDFGDLTTGTYELPVKGSSDKPVIRCAVVWWDDYRGALSNTYFSNLYIVKKGGSTPNSPLYNSAMIRWEDAPTGTYGEECPPQYVSYNWDTYGSSDTYRWVQGWGTYGGIDKEYGLHIAIYGEDDDAAQWDTIINKVKEETANGGLQVTGLPIDFDTEKVFYTTINGRTAIGTQLLDSLGRVYGDKETVAQKNKVVDWLIQNSGSLFVPTKIETPIVLETPVKEETSMPKLDYLIESGNRLWGCRYGTNNAGEFVNEVYATVLGDFKHWYKYDGISTDAWTASVGTSGEFTGAINFGGKPIFFKEDCMHRVYGEYVPFSMQMTPCKGVQKGCHKSLAIVNDVLYYKSRTGICAYDGSYPVEITNNFGDKQYYNAVGGALGNKYYISMQDEDGAWHMFVYDTIKRLWHREDDTQATQFCNHQGELYYIDHADHYIHSVKGTGVQETTPIPWSAETGILGATTPDNKYVTRIDVRMAVSKGSKMSMHIEYDSMGEWERLMEIEGLTLNTFTIPVIPRRCDHFRIKLEGEGEVKIFSITKTLEDAE